MHHSWMLAGMSALLLSACGGKGAEDANAATPTTVADGQETHETPAARVTPTPEGSLAALPMALGNDAAPVKITEYASVTCPGCAAFHSVGWPFVKGLLIDTNRIQFEYREFPTNPQNLAYAGFYLARCTATTAGPTGYFKILDTLYARQRDWAYGQTPGDSLANIAAQAGIDREGLEDCFYREDIKNAVQENVKAGYAADVRATPSFFVNDEAFNWSGTPLSLLHKAEADLAAAGAEGIPAGATATAEIPFDFCGELVKNTERALPGNTTILEDTDLKKVLSVNVADGGSLMATCAAEVKDDPSTHRMTVAKVAAP